MRNQTTPGHKTAALLILISFQTLCKIAEFHKYGKQYSCYISCKIADSLHSHHIWIPSSETHSGDVQSLEF